MSQSGAEEGPTEPPALGQVGASHALLSSWAAEALQKADGGGGVCASFQGTTSLGAPSARFLARALERATLQ